MSAKTISSVLERDSKVTQKKSPQLSGGKKRKHKENAGNQCFTLTWKMLTPVSVIFHDLGDTITVRGQIQLEILLIYIVENRIYKEVMEYVEADGLNIFLRLILFY